MLITYLQLHEVSLTYLSLYGDLVFISAETFDWINDLNFTFWPFFPVFDFPPESVV